jgi:hypothetical protein
MGTFAETTMLSIVLSFADQGKNKLPFSVLRWQKTDGSLPFPFSVCSKQTEVAIFR